MRVFKDLFIRNLEADTYLENFIISAIVSVFSIRIFLLLADYPQLGGGIYHIAHIIWGGFFMLMALVILLSFMSQKAMAVAAVLGGIGFGAFIDELGKFITSENDYFFEPTIAYIYIIFILLYLISRLIPAYRKVSQREYLVNAIEMIKESAVNDFDKEEEAKAAEYLAKCNQKNPTVKALKRLLDNLEISPTPRPGLFTRIRTFFRRQYYAIAQSGIVLNGVIFFLAFQTFLAFSTSVSVSFTQPDLSFSESGHLYSSILAGLFVMIGLFALRLSRTEAYRFFRIAVLISILLTDFFRLIKPEWTDGLFLAGNVFTLLVINYAMHRDQQAKVVRKVRSGRGDRV